MTAVDVDVEPIGRAVGLGGVEAPEGGPRRFFWIPVAMAWRVNPNVEVLQWSETELRYHATTVVTVCCFSAKQMA